MVIVLPIVVGFTVVASGLALGGLLKKLGFQGGSSPMPDPTSASPPFKHRPALPNCGGLAFVSEAGVDIRFA